LHRILPDPADEAVALRVGLEHVHSGVEIKLAELPERAASFSSASAWECGIAILTGRNSRLRLIVQKAPFCQNNLSTN